MIESDLGKYPEPVQQFTEAMLIRAGMSLADITDIILSDGDVNYKFESDELSNKWTKAHNQE